MKVILLTLSLWIPFLLTGQKITSVSKYFIGMEIDIGHSFPNFDIEQDRWKATFYPAGGLTVLFSNRINERWMADLGLGITGYALTNRGSVDHYVLDFLSPTFSSGISYSMQNHPGQENFIKLTSGFQVGYQGKLLEEFDLYTVEIEGKNTLYPFIKPEIGIRRYSRYRMKGSQFKMAYEFGVFFRYNLRTLGMAKIQEKDLEVTLEPSGNIIGGSFKILFPAGGKRVRLQGEKAKTFPSIIYNPRST